MTYHVPVLRSEVVELLQPHPRDTIVDGTLGGGGHATILLQRIQPGGTLIGFDQDVVAIRHIKTTLGQEYGSNQLIVIHDNFRHLRQYCTQANAILLDLGVSSYQLSAGERGFSFRAVTEPLDLRMDIRQAQTGAELLNELSEEALSDIFRDYGEVRRARHLAEVIVRRRLAQPMRTVQDLLDCVAEVYRQPNSQILAPIWQALRIAVNAELDLLPAALSDAISILSSGGRLAVITFHSLEDRIVKHHFQELVVGCTCPPELPVCVCQRQPTIKLITRKPVVPSSEEIAINPKSRSAKLRVIEKI